MKKTLVILALTVLIGLIGINAQVFKVEKAEKVSFKGKAIVAGQTINDNIKIKIANAGYILFVDTQNHKRYYINLPCEKKIKDLIKNTPSPIKISSSYLESLFKDNESQSKFESSASTNRGDEEEIVSDFAMSDNTRGEVRPDSVPEPIRLDVLTFTEDTVSIYYIIP